MKIEKWKYKDREVEIPVFEEPEFETNTKTDDLENTIDLTKTLESIQGDESVD